MSLGGLAIAIGMLIDALVVVVENIVGNLEQGSEGQARAARPYRVPVGLRGAGAGCDGRADHHHRFRAAADAAGARGQSCSLPVALAIIFALAASLLLALTVIPVATSFLLKAAPHREPWLIRLASRGYAPALGLGAGQ